MVSYSARHKYLLTSDNIYSNVLQETQADETLTELAEEIFLEHTTTQSQEPNQERKERSDTTKDETTTPTDKLIPFCELNDLQNIFSRRACHKSHSFQQCFKKDKIGLIFKNEKKLGALISKRKL